MKKDKVAGMLGLAMRAGKLSLGSDAAEAMVIKGRARLLLVDLRASANTRKRFSQLCERRGCRMIELPQAFLQNTLNRGNLTAVAVLDENFASSILKNYMEEPELSQS